jgi:hypothetical protein
VGSILSNAEKMDISNGLDGVAATFVRPLYIYQEAQQTVVITDPLYNPIDGYNQNNLNVTNLANFTLISGRVLYDKQQEFAFARPYVGRGPNEGQLKLKDQTTRSVRIKVDATGYALLNTAKKIELDGLQFDRESMPRPHGLFVPNYYTLYFVRSM